MKRRAQKGISLVSVMIFMTASVVGGLAVMSYLQNQQKQSRFLRMSQSVDFIESQIMKFTNISNTKRTVLTSALFAENQLILNCITPGVQGSPAEVCVTGVPIPFTFYEPHVTPSLVPPPKPLAGPSTSPTEAVRYSASGVFCGSGGSVPRPSPTPFCPIVATASFIGTCPGAAATCDGFASGYIDYVIEPDQTFYEKAFKKRINVFKEGATFP